MRDNKTKIITGSVVALAVIVVLGLVYAAFTQQLNINGTATGRSSSWKIYFSRLTGPVLNGTAKQITAPEIKNNSTTIGDYEVTVTSPGDYIEYEFDVTNDGDYDATLTGLTKNSNTELTYEGSGDNKSIDETNVMNQIEYTLKYSDGTTVSQNDTLKSKETKTMRLRLTYKTFDDASLLPKQDVAISGLGISLTYTQDGNAKVNDDGTTPYVDPYSHHIGDTFTLNGDSYHIIANSLREDDYVVALKDTPLTVSEINTYGAGHINMHMPKATEGDFQQVRDIQGDGTIGGIAYYTSNDCGPSNDPDKPWMGNKELGCTTSYNSSEIKYIVDAWSQAKFTNELKNVNNYSSRLIKQDEYVPLIDITQKCTEGCYDVISTDYDWVYNSNYSYWTMTPNNDSLSEISFISSDGRIQGDSVYAVDKAVRPVINVYKSAIAANNN